MKNNLEKQAQLDVEITNLSATGEEIEKLKNLIVTGLGNNVSTLQIKAVSHDVKGSIYEVNFRVIDPRLYNDSMVQDWLYEAGLVRWCLDSTFVHSW